MRKLMWFAIGFSAACAGCVYIKSGHWILVAAIAVGLFLLLLPAFRSLRRPVLCAVIGCGVGLAWFLCFDRIYIKPVRDMDEQAVILEIEVTDYGRPGEYGTIGEGKTKIQGKTYSIQFYVNEDVALAPGDRVEGGFRLRYTGGGSEKPTYHQGKGIFLLAYPKGSTPETYAEIDQEFYYVTSKLRQKIVALVDWIFPADTSGFVRALLLGDTGELSFETAWSLRTTGIFHIVAVSGMHISILFGIVCILCVKRRYLIAFVGLPVLVLFAGVAGFSPSVVRSCIMQALMILALLTDNEYDPPTALAAAAFAILVVNPLAITSVSFQLSVGCMAGIFLFSGRIYQYIMRNTCLGPAKGKSLRARLTRWAVGSVSVTLGAMSLTTPLSAYYFDNISLSGVFANLLILWLISLIFYCVVAACVFGALWLPLGVGIGWLISWPIRLVLWVVNMISKVPLSSVYTSSIYIVAWLIFAYVMVMVFLKSKKKHPFVLVVCILLGLLGTVTCSYVEPRLDNYRITAVDVGQGQCLILQNDGKYYMVDCGGDSGDQAATRAAQLLLSQGVFRLDGLIITHYDADHVAGVPQLLSVIPAKTLYLPVQEGESDVRDALVAKYADKICWITEDISLDAADIKIFASNNTADSNESSLCILFQPENCDILITGDRAEEGEQALMNHTTLPDLEILIAGHHGSRTSTSWELLNVTRPEIVIISVGEDNRYGHPTWETLERLDLFGCDVYRTDTQGTIIFRG